MPSTRSNRNCPEEERREVTTHIGQKTQPLRDSQLVRGWGRTRQSHHMPMRTIQLQRSMRTGSGKLSWRKGPVLGPEGQEVRR